MKTAMQELIEWVEERFSNPHQTEVFKKATELLEKEKEQIIDFHIMLMKNGLEQEGNVIEWDYNELKQEALEFYNQTYNQNNNDKCGCFVSDGTTSMNCKFCGKHYSQHI